MRLLIKIVFPGCILLLILFTAGCTRSAGQPNTEEKTVTMQVTDFMGNVLRFEKSPERVVCLIESALSGIYMLGMKERLVAIPGDVYRGKTFFYYAQLDERIKEKSIPAPGNWDFVNIEQVVGLNPDLVIIWSSQAEAIINLQQFGIPVYGVMMQDFDDVFKEIDDFGKLFDCKQRADNLIAFTRSNLEKTKTENIFKNPVPVYFMWAQGINETSGKNSTVEELLNYAGTSNVCDLDHEHVTVSLEKLIEWNPEMIVMWYNEKLDPADIMENPVLQGLNAVKNKRVYELPVVFTCDFWTLKMQYPVNLIASWAYPETSGQFESEREMKELYRFLYGKEIRLVE
jgi:iron complex transport system substrate-binding protein